MQVILRDSNFFLFANRTFTDSIFIECEDGHKIGEWRDGAFAAVLDCIKEHPMLKKRMNEINLDRPSPEEFFYFVCSIVLVDLITRLAVLQVVVNQEDKSVDKATWIQMQLDGVK